MSIDTFRPPSANRSWRNRGRGVDGSGLTLADLPPARSCHRRGVRMLMLVRQLGYAQLTWSPWQDVFEIESASVLLASQGGGQGKGLKFHRGFQDSPIRHYLQNKPMDAFDLAAAAS